MLRNSLKIAFCGLIILGLCGCSSTKPLLVPHPKNVSLDNIKIKADPGIEYRVSGIVNRLLPHYVKNPEKYVINITVKETSSSAVYTRKEVAKEQLRMAAFVEVYDNEYNEIGSKFVDSFATYEVCDELTFSVLSSQTQARNTVADSLGEAVVLAVKSIVG